MKTHPLKLVTIIAEAVIADRLVREIQALGAKGHTLTTVEGKGSRGVRASEWEGKNVKIETLVGEEVAERILDVLSLHYFPNFAVVAHVQEVGVVRGEKYV